jgi:spore germination protein KB
MKSLVKILIPRQLFLMIILSTGLLNHVILIPNLLKASGRDSWVSILIAYPIALLFLLLLHYSIKNSSSEGFYTMIRIRFGKVVFMIFSIPIVLFLLIATYVTFRDLLIWLNTYFLAEAPIFMIIFMLIVVCYLLTQAGIKTMAIASGLLLPVVTVLGFFVAISNTSLKDPSQLLPVLTVGYSPVLKGIMYVLSGFLELYIVILLQPFSQEPIKFKHLFILLTILTGLTFGPLSASIMEFGSLESVNFQYPAYRQWRVLGIGEYISNLDFFALYQWLSGALIRIGLFMYLIGWFLTNKKNDYRLNPKLVVTMYVLLFCLMLVKVESYYFYEFIYKYYLPSCFVFFLFHIVISALIIFVIKKRDEKKHDQSIDTSH